ncbi:unnamed protein product [Closterium sp. NIES-64]|nr:unnamed protein product [Closterium sp. NIES-64]
MIVSFNVVLVAVMLASSAAPSCAQVQTPSAEASGRGLPATPLPPSPLRSPLPSSLFTSSPPPVPFTSPFLLPFTPLFAFSPLSPMPRCLRCLWCGCNFLCGSGGGAGAQILEAMVQTQTFPPFPRHPPPPPPPVTSPPPPPPLEPLSPDATNTFASGNHLGQGTYGMVYKAKLSFGDVVAVKRAKADRKQDAGKFRKEIELLSRVSHKNLVRLVGYCREGGEQLLVYEYVAGGNLPQNLNPTWRERESQPPPTEWTERLLIAAGTARGLAYLHEEINATAVPHSTGRSGYSAGTARGLAYLHEEINVPFIHRDVKPSNIMIDRHVVAKIADFGTTKPMTPEELRKMSVTIQGTTPSNIMIDRHVVAKVADFGTSKLEEVQKMSVTIQGTSVSALESACCECLRVVEWCVSPVPLADFGTSKPMTPEELRKMSVTIQGTTHSSKRINVYSLGIVLLLELLTGKGPLFRPLFPHTPPLPFPLTHCNPDYQQHALPLYVSPSLFLLHPPPHPQGYYDPDYLRIGHSLKRIDVLPVCGATPTSNHGYYDPDYLRTGHSSKRINMLPYQCYCDPDYLRMRHSSKRIDVYSLGIVLLELLTGKGPHKVKRPYRFDAKDRFDRGGLPAIVDPTMGLYPADELHHVFDFALRCTALNRYKLAFLPFPFPRQRIGLTEVKDRFDEGGLPSIIDPTMGLYPADELHHVFDLALRCTDIQNPAALRCTAVKDRFDEGGLPSIIDPTMGLYPADELHHVFDLALRCTDIQNPAALRCTAVKDRFDEGGLPSIIDPTMGLYPADELHHVFDLALRCTDIQNPAALRCTAVKDRFDEGGLPSIIDPTMGLYPADELHHVFDLALRCTDIQNPAALRCTAVKDRFDEGGLPSIIDPTMGLYPADELHHIFDLALRCTDIQNPAALRCTAVKDRFDEGGLPSIIDPTMGLYPADELHHVFDLALRCTDIHNPAALRCTAVKDRFDEGGLPSIIDPTMGVKDRFDRGGLPSIVDPIMGLYPADELHHVFDLALRFTDIQNPAVKDRFDTGGLPSIVDPTMGLYPTDELHHVFDLALRCTDIQNPTARPSMSRVVAELEVVLEPEAISRFISSGPPSHDSADFRTVPSGSGAGPGGAGLTRFAGARKQVGQGGGEGGTGSAAAGSGVEGLAVGGTAGAALAAAISSASPSRSDAGDSPLTPDPPIPPNRSQPQPTPACYAPLPPPSSKRTPGPPAFKGRAVGVAAAGAAEATGGDIRDMRDRELDGACVPTGPNDPRSTGRAYVVSHDVGVQMKPAPVAAFRGASAAAGGGATGAGDIVAGASGGNAGGIGGGGDVAAPNQEYRAGEGFGEGGGGGERGEGGYEEGLDASFDSSRFDRSGVFSYGAMPPA